jgi:hypothetical protein
MRPRLMQLQQGGRPLPSSIRQIGSAPRDPMQKQEKGNFSRMMMHDHLSTAMTFSSH